MKLPYHVLVENGNKTLVSSCRRILEYSPERIEIQLKSARVSICGKDLTLCDFFGDELQIAGVVEMVNFKGENIES